MAWRESLFFNAFAYLNHFTDQQRLLVLDDGAIVGWIGFMRDRGAHPFDLERGIDFTRSPRAFDAEA